MTHTRFQARSTRSLFNVSCANAIDADADADADADDDDDDDDDDDNNDNVH